MAPEVTKVAPGLSYERNTGPNSLRLGELGAKRRNRLWSRVFVDRLPPIEQLASPSGGFQLLSGLHQGRTAAPSIFCSDY